MYWFITKIIKWTTPREAITICIGLVKASDDKTCPWLKKDKPDVIVEPLGFVK